MTPPRHLEVGPQRVLRWVTGFTQRHGTLTWEPDGEELVLRAADGSVARLRSWAGADVTADVQGPGQLDSWAGPPHVLGLVLIRRGGYAVGLARGSELVSHKSGTRYVQSRTAAGGWSQQRFARRRGNQADALVGTVTEHVLRLVVPRAPSALVAGGDRALVREVLHDPRLAVLGDLPRRELFDLPDPRLHVLRQALDRARAVRVTLTEAG